MTAFVNREAGAATGPARVPTVIVPVRRVATASTGSAASRPCCRAWPRARASTSLHIARLDGARRGARSRASRRSTTSTTASCPRRTSACGRSGMRVLVPLAARRSHRVIADSRATRATTSSHLLGVDPAKVDVVPLGARRGRRRATPTPEARAAQRGSTSAAGRVVLSVVGQAPAQEPRAPARGARADRRRATGPVLVLPGYPTPHEARAARARRARWACAAASRFLGWVDAAETRGPLRRRGRASSFPSLARGLRPARARGDEPAACPWRARASTPVGSVAGDAALKFDPPLAAGDRRRRRAAARRSGDRGVARRGRSGAGGAVHPGGHGAPHARRSTPAPSAPRAARRRPGTLARHEPQGQARADLPQREQREPARHPGRREPAPRARVCSTSAAATAPSPTAVAERVAADRTMGFELIERLRRAGARAGGRGDRGRPRRALALRRWLGRRRALEPGDRARSLHRPLHGSRSGEC